MIPTPSFSRRRRLLEQFMASAEHPSKGSGYLWQSSLESKAVDQSWDFAKRCLADPFASVTLLFAALILLHKSELDLDGCGAVSLS